MSAYSNDELPTLAQLRIREQTSFPHSSAGPVNQQSSHLEPFAQKPRPRNRSPLSRSHLRSQSAASALQSTSMARTRSLPSSTTYSGRSPVESPIRSSSPLHSSPTAVRAPPRRSLDEMYNQPTLPSFSDFEIIAEDSVLDLTPRGVPERELQSSPVIVSYSPQNWNNIPRPSSSGGRRRPTSPLHSSQLAPSTPSYLTSPPAAMSSPSLATTAKYNEAFPPNPASFPVSAPSSVASTPTSFRSRSPSISSLETIPDSPDAEEAAIEAYNIAKLKAAADAEDAAVEEEFEFDTDRRRNPRWNSIAGLRDKRKRWSVCGAERRGDFEMETIWED